MEISPQGQYWPCAGQQWLVQKGGSAVHFAVVMLVNQLSSAYVSVEESAGLRVALRAGAKSYLSRPCRMDAVAAKLADVMRGLVATATSARRR